MLKFEESRRIEERFFNFVLYFQNCSNLYIKYKWNLKLKNLHIKEIATNVVENVDRIVTVCTTGWKGGGSLWKNAKMCSPKIKQCIIWSSKSTFGYTQGKGRWGVLKQVLINCISISRLFTISQIYKKFINILTKNVVYMHERLLCSLAGSNVLTFYNMDESWGLYAKWSWSQTKGKFWCYEKPLPRKRSKSVDSRKPRITIQCQL